MKVSLNGKEVTITKEQLRYFDNLTDLQKRYALNFLSGMSKVDAYVKAANRTGKESLSTLTSSATNMHYRLQVQQFLKTFERGVIEQMAEIIMTREEMALELQKMAKATVTMDDLKDSTNLCEFVSEVIRESDGTIRYKLTTGKDRRDAMKQLAELMGYNKPQEVNVTLNSTLSKRQKEILDKTLDEEF